MIKPRKVRCLRRQRESTSDSDTEQTDNCTDVLSVQSTEVAGAIRELQKLRKRPAGISLTALSTGKDKTETNLSISNDPFKLKTGGMVDMRGMSGSKAEDEEDDLEARLAKTFSTETNKRDEDAEMIKYIEEELAKRKGLGNCPLPDSKEDSGLLRDVPEYLRPAIGQQKEDMLSNQMLCGIPEIDLGVEAKMKNIEATEEAKQLLLANRYRQKNGHLGDGMAPVNMAVNFVQHNRWNSYTNVVSVRAELENKRDLVDLNKALKASREKSMLSPICGESRRGEGGQSKVLSEKATDSIVFQRFKNHMRGRRNR